MKAIIKGLLKQHGIEIAQKVRGDLGMEFQLAGEYEGVVVAVNRNSFSVFKVNDNRTITFFSDGGVISRIKAAVGKEA